MYVWIYRSLPGPAVVRALIMLAAALAVVAACLTWLFPWVAQQLEGNTSVDGALGSSVSVALFR